jgi:hypothetical protein
MKTKTKQERHGINKYIRIQAGDVPLLADLLHPG